MAGVTIGKYGTTTEGEDVVRAELDNGTGLVVTVLSYGGILQGIWWTDRDGQADRVTLGFDDLEPYETISPYFGATIGRYANRIDNGRFVLDGKTYRVPPNDPFGSMHGGPEGFDKRNWDLRQDQDGSTGVILERTSADGEEGFPGNLHVQLHLSLVRAESILRFEYKATTDAPTIVNMTNHSYFNLGGAGKGSALGHYLTLNADAFLPVDNRLLPTGEFRPVKGTPFDFREPHKVSERIRNADEQLRLGLGYDHNVAINGWVEGSMTPRFASRLEHRESGRMLEVWTTEPALDIYSGNQLDGSIIGAGGRIYRAGDAIAMEPEHYTNSVNIDSFPSTVLRPGEEYRSISEFRFGHC